MSTPVVDPALFMAADWPAPRRVRALTTLRQGGVSVAPFDSLNLGQRGEDAPAALAENLRRLRQAAGLPADPVWLQQVHGATVVDVDHDPQHVADAAVTCRPGVVLAIQTADCLPVVLATADARCIAVAHAGWRGLAAGVLQNTVAAVAERAPGVAIHAWLGPAIGPERFEVGAEVVAAFCDADPDAEIAFRENARGRWQCDLYTLARRALAMEGVASFHGGGLCTHSDAGRFFSYRREARTGRMATLAWIEPVAPGAPATLATS